MAYVQDLIAGICAPDALLLGYVFDAGQYRVSHALERLGDKRGADGARRIAGAERNHAPTPAHGDRRCREQIARQIEDMARIVLAADARRREADHLVLFDVCQPDRAADARVEGAVLGEWHRNHALAKIGFDEQAFFARLSDQVGPIKRRMRPGRLREVFDRGRQLLMALDKQDIGGLESPAKRLCIGWTEWLIAADRRLEPFGDAAADRIQNCVDEGHAASAPARAKASFPGRAMVNPRLCPDAAPSSVRPPGSRHHDRSRRPRVRARCACSAAGSLLLRRHRRWSRRPSSRRGRHS